MNPLHLPPGGTGISGLAVAGAGLFLAGALLAGALIRNCRRRPRLPRLRYGAWRPGEPATRWAWTLVLAGGFLAGVEGVPLVVRADARVSAPDPHGEARTPARQALRIPFYERERVVRPGPGVGTIGAAAADPSTRVVTEEERLELPWPFLLAAALYWLLVVRWPAEGSREG